MIAMVDWELWLISGGIAICMIIVGLGLMGVTFQTPVWRAMRHMRGRDALDDTAFGEHYFPQEHAVVAARMRQILKEHLPIDLSQMSPDDWLVRDLRMDAMDSWSTLEFVQDVEEEFGIQIPDAEGQKMRTLRDVIDYVVAHSDKVAKE